MTQTAINALCEMLDQDDGNNGQWERKAEIICQFAFKVSEQVLLRAGFVKPSAEGAGDNAGELWLGNSLVSLTDNEIRIPDHVTELCLNKVDSTLSRSETYRAEDTEVLLVFARGRVLDWNEKTEKPRRVMTYEEAARFIVFWLAEKVLQICRKNEWDRIKQLPDLFDRLAGFLVASPVYSGAEVLRQKLNLPYNPDSLLLAVEDLKHQMSRRLYHSLANAVCNGRNPNWPDYKHREALASDRLGYIATLHLEDFYGLKNMGRKSREELIALLEPMGLTLGMSFPPEVRAWYEAQAQSLKK